MLTRKLDIMHTLCLKINDTKTVKMKINIILNKMYVEQDYIIDL